ncbi:MAG: hypothetical protein RIT45_840, partial [Pseudomonadota bacterium]
GPPRADAKLHKHGHGPGVRRAIVAAALRSRLLHGAAIYPMVWGYPEHEVVAALENRTTRTDKLLARLCAGGCCRDDLVPTVTLREVQERFWLDDRIRVAALDGVVIGPFAEVMEYRDDGCPRMDRFEADPSLLGVLERPADAMNLDRCTDHPWVRGVNDAFTARSSSLPGWRWDNAGELLIRECSR